MCVLFCLCKCYIHGTYNLCGFFIGQVLWVNLGLVSQCLFGFRSFLDGSFLCYGFCLGFFCGSGFFSWSLFWSCLFWSLDWSYLFCGFYFSFFTCLWFRWCQIRGAACWGL